jgi:hypothetical protein
VDSTNVYWTQSLASGGSIMRAPKGGGTAVLLASGQSAPRIPVLDATSVYWINNSPPGGLMKVAIGGGAPTALVPNIVPQSVVVDASFAYYGEWNPGTVSKVPIGGGPPTVLATGQVGVNDVTADATSLYWTEAEVGTIMKLAK